MTILYSTGCERYKEVEVILKLENVKYTISSDVDHMKTLGIAEVPVLQMPNCELISYKDIIETYSGYVAKWLGVSSDALGVDIWTKKYQQNGETFNQWLCRVSGNNIDIAKMIYEKKFLFGGRILSNRGLRSEERRVGEEC